MSLLSRLAVQASRAYGLLSSGRSTNVSADFLVVAGGAGAQQGGGGAGGYQASTFTLSTLNTYSITVGAGGPNSGASNVRGGSNSVVSGTGITTITSLGGGYGGGGGYQAGTGGSGGGGSNDAPNTAGTGTAGQGNNGGAGVTNAGGGGGGSGAIGSNASGTTGGAGGAGTASSISGSSVTYAGGGGGAGSGAGGSAGSGGAGAGGSSGNGGSGTANTGSGGGGSWSGTPGAGGSGIVIISYTATAPKFVGGTITTSGGKQIHTFTSSGTLSPVTEVTASYLVVAGGGGAVGNRSGGGGAGGLLSGSTTLYSPATYIITVGAGGAGGAGTAATSSTQDGSNSILSGTGLTTITSTGGGGGGGTNNPSSGRAGGSGGGAGGDNPTGATGGTGTSGQGFAGGTSAAGGGGGGGGASAVGSNGTSNTGANGGAGTSSSISGSSVTYAGGGGGGGTTTGGTGGSGGGGNGAGGSPTTQSRGVDGTQNLGGGAGGGSNYTTTAVTQASGGSGVVIISYAGSQKFNGGTITTSGGNTIHTFYATGALTPVTNNLTNSLRFRSSASAYLSRTPSVAGNRKTYTFSAWIKRGALNAGGNDMCLFNAGTTSPNYDGFRIKSDTISFFQGGAVSVNIESTQVFRDPSAWYHLVLAVDTTQATAANRVKIYVNGNQITAFGTANYPAQNAEAAINNTLVHNIAAQYANTSSTSFVDGYMADINFIDGQALEPYYFGSNDENNIWKPIKYYGTYGTNGFRLAFTNTTSTTTIGYDSSPNGNNWTTNNISLTAGTTYDAMTDVPTNTSATQANYAVLNPLDVNAVTSITEANLYSSLTASGSAIVRSTIAVTSGKYYWEVIFGSTGDTLMVGVCDATTSLTNSLWSTTNAWMYYSNNGNKYNSSSAAYGATFTNADIIGVALDMDAGTLTFYKNNVSQGVAYNSGLTGKTLTPTIQSAARALTAYANFGQRPFAYTPPSGYVALNTYNLSTPTIIQGNRYMDATTFTGAGATQVIVNAAQFKPDFIWTKQRNVANDNYLVDSVRGASQYLISNKTDAEATAAQYVTSFNSNGFTLGTSGYTTSQTVVGWQWQAGQGTTSSNTNGSITSTVSVNTTAGFSIVTYTGNSTSGATIGHGLGVAPKMIIVKTRNAVDNWAVYHSSTGATQYLQLNNTNASASSITLWNNTAPTSSVFYLGTNNDVNDSARTYVAYCFAEISGFSKFGSYTGNGSADGSFVYTGFRPKFVMVKRFDTTGEWLINDSSRDTYNPEILYLQPNLSSAEGTLNPSLDFLSNGFKFRTANANYNASGGTYIYMAFAENPYKYANAR